MDAVTLAAANAAAKKKYVPKTGLKGSLPSTWYSAHRNNLNVYPENTLEGVRACMSLGSHGINVDLWPLVDGGGGCMHDQTLDRTTSSTGNITDLDSSAVQQLVVDTATWFAPNSAWGNLKVPLTDEVMRQFGNRAFLELEAKPFTGSGAALVKLLVQYGVGPDMARIGSFTASELTAGVAAGYDCCLLLTSANHASTTTASVIAQGFKWIGLDITSADLLTQTAINAEVARWHAAGIKVHASTIQRRIDAWPWVAAGADSIAADDDIYVRPDWKPLTADPFKSGNFAHGMIAQGGTQSYATRGSFVGPLGNARHQMPAGLGSCFNVQGWGSPIAGAIETTLQRAVSAGATSIIVGPQNKPLAGTTLTLDPPPSGINATAVGAGGSFSAATYYWTATGVTASGETGQSVEKSAAIVASGSATIAGVVPPAATTVNVYRGTAPGGAKALIGQATISGTGFTFTDTGAAGTTAPPAGITESVTPTASSLNADGTYTATVPALASAHTARVRVYGGAFTITGTMVFDTLGSDVTRWGAICFGSPDDTKYQDTGAVTDTAYIVHIRGNGAPGVGGRSYGTGLTGGPIEPAGQAVPVPLVLSAGLAAGTAITSLPVNALPAGIANAQRFVLPTGQIVTASGATSSGATAVTIASVTPTTAVASGASVPAAVPWKIQRTATQVIFTRTDTNQSQTWNDTSLFGGYFHFGYNGGAGAPLFSFQAVSITTP